MPTQRKSAKSSKKSSGKSTPSSSKSGSKSRSSSRSTQSRGGSQSSRSTAGKRATGSRRGKAANALELLTKDHREVQKAFRKAERMESGDRQLQEIVETTCAALKLHAEIEEQLFYPAIQGEDNDIVQEALVEHDSAKQLIAQLEAIGPRDERYKATFKVLGEYVNHHIEEEESTVFRAARRAKIDMEALGEQILMIKEGGSAAELEEGSASKTSRSGSRSNRGASDSGGSRSSRSSRGTSSGDSRSSGGDDSQAALDDETESGGIASRTGGDSSEDSERPGRGGRRAASSVEDVDDGEEIDVETPGRSSRHDTH